MSTLAHIVCIWTLFNLAFFAIRINTAAKRSSALRQEGRRSTGSGEQTYTRSPEPLSPRRGAR